MYETRKRTRKLRPCATPSPHGGLLLRPRLPRPEVRFHGARCRPTRWATTNSIRPTRASMPSACRKCVGVGVDELLTEPDPRNEGPEQARHLGCAQGQDHRRTGAQQFLNFLADSMGLSNIGVSFRSSLIQELPASNSGSASTPTASRPTDAATTNSSSRAASPARAGRSTIRSSQAKPHDTPP